MSDNVSEPLEEDGVEVVQAGGFTRLKREDSPLNFTIRYLSWYYLEDMRWDGLEVRRGVAEIGTEMALEE